MTRRPNGTQWSDFLLLDPDSTNRFANKVTAVPPVLGDQDIHGLIAFAKALWRLFRRGFMVAAILAGLLGLGVLVARLTHGGF